MLKMGATGSSDKLVTTYKALHTWHQKPKNNSPKSKYNALNSKLYFSLSEINIHIII
jgi:hypothetical protein